MLAGVWSSKRDGLIAAKKTEARDAGGRWIAALVTIAATEPSTERRGSSCSS